MSHAAARHLVAAVVVATVALEVAAVALAVGVAPLDQPVLYAVYAAVQAVAGAIIVWHYPRHPIGWLLAGFALLNAIFGDAALSVGRHGSAEGWPGAAYAEMAGLTSWIFGAPGMILLFLLFPDGHYLSRGWRWVPAGWLAGAALATPGWVLNPRLGQDLSDGVNPWATDAWWVEPAFAVGLTLICLAMAASVVALLLRFRRARGLERQQLKWVMLAGALVVVVLPTSAALWTAWPPIQYAPALVLPLLPISVCVAVVRQHLYDIDLVISRTVAYATVTGLLGAAYAGIVLAVGVFVASPVAAAAGALVAAVAFRPVRTRVQDAVDRRFRRARYESRRLMTEFVDRLRRGEVGADAVEHAVRAAVHDEELVLGFGTEGTTYDVQGRPLDLPREPGRRITTVDTGQQVVALVRHREADERRVVDVLAAGRLALEIASLQVELRRRLKQLDTPGPGSSRSPTRSAAASTATCTTVPSSGWCRSGSTLRHAQHALNGSCAAAEVRRSPWTPRSPRLSNGDRRAPRVGYAGCRPAQLDDGLAPALSGTRASRSPHPGVRCRMRRARFDTRASRRRRTSSRVRGSPTRSSSQCRSVVARVRRPGPRAAGRARDRRRQRGCRRPSGQRTAPA